MSDPVAELKTLIADQPKNPLRPYQIEALTEEKKRHETALKAPEWHGVNRGQAAASLRRITTMLATQAPKPLDPVRRDLVAKKTREVIETVIKPAMQPVEVMRRCPVGAVDAYQAGEGSPRVKTAILAAKAALRAIEPDNAEQDYTNFEKFRPSVAGIAGPTATFMADAQIGGHLAMTPMAKANWPLGDPTVKTALAGAEYVPADEAPAPHPNASYTPEGDQANRQARAAGLDTVARQCALDGCGNWFQATTKGPNPRKFCTPEHSMTARAQKHAAAVKARRAAAASAPPAPAPSPEA